MPITFPHRFTSAKVHATFVSASLPWVHFRMTAAATPRRRDLATCLLLSGVFRPWFIYLVPSFAPCGTLAPSTSLGWVLFYATLFHHYLCRCFLSSPATFLVAHLHVIFCCTPLRTRAHSTVLASPIFRDEWPLVQPTLMPISSHLDVRLLHCGRAQWSAINVIDFRQVPEVVQSRLLFIHVFHRIHGVYPLVASAFASPLLLNFLMAYLIILCSRSHSNFWPMDSSCSHISYWGTLRRDGNVWFCQLHLYMPTRVATYRVLAAPAPSLVTG